MDKLARQAIIVIGSTCAFFWLLSGLGFVLVAAGHPAAINMGIGVGTGALLGTVVTGVLWRAFRRDAQRFGIDR